MNVRERIVYNWLKTEYPNETILFNVNQTPDFIVGDKEFEVKKIGLYNTLFFSPKQMEVLKPTTMILAVNEARIVDKFYWKDKLDCDYRISPTSSFASTHARIDKELLK